MAGICPWQISSAHGCQSYCLPWEGHVTFISLLIVLPALDVVILRKDRGARKKGRTKIHILEPRLNSRANMLTAITPMAAQMTPGPLGFASCLPQNSIPISSYPESLPYVPYSSIPWWVLQGRSQGAGTEGEERRVGCGVAQRPYTIDPPPPPAPGSTHLHLLGIRKQWQQAMGNGAGGEKERWGF